MTSNSVPQDFGGMACPLSMSFGRAHGPQSLVAYMTVDGVVNPPLGTGIWMQIDSALFVGFISKLESNGDTTTIRAVDWRDRLQDQHYYAAYNMQEQDGRFFHVLAQDWLTQKRTWISRELIQQDFDKVQASGDTLELLLNVAKQNLVSALSLMQHFAQQFDFKFTAEQNAYQTLSRSYPLNLDWNGGSRRGEVIQSLLERCGCQFTCYGFKNLHVTARGYTDDAFSAQFLQGLTSYCTVGATEGSIGVEFNERGRRAVILGDRNKYEMVFPCIINWNPIWDANLCFNDYNLYALLATHDLTRQSKLKELPEEYHDNQTWDDNDFAGEGELGVRKTRNDMEIQDYVEKVCFHVYKVNCLVAARKFTRTADEWDGEVVQLDATGLRPAITDDDTASGSYSTFNLKDTDLTLGWDDEGQNFQWPIAAKLITDSNLQYLVYATSNKLIRGAKFPFDEQKVFLPKDAGVTLSVEELMDPDDLTKVLYCARVTFNNAQVWLDKNKPISDLTAIQYDRVLVRLTLDAEYFNAVYGEQQNGPRVREQKLSVRNLYQAFVLNDNSAGTAIFGPGPAFPVLGTGAVEEVGVLRQNYVKNLAAGGVVAQAKVVRANDVAYGIAKQLLNHPFQLRSGSLTFDGRAGIMVDGVIESTSITFDGQRGITEIVNLTSERIDDQLINAPVVIRTSRVEKTEEDLVKDRMIAIDLAVRASTDAAKKVMAVADAGIRGITGLMKPAELETAFGASSSIEVTLPKAVIEDHDHKVGDIFIVGK